MIPAFAKAASAAMAFVGFLLAIIPWPDAVLQWWLHRDEPLPRDRR